MQNRLLTKVEQHTELTYFTLRSTPLLYCDVWHLPSVLWHCWMGIRNSIRPVKWHNQYTTHTHTHTRLTALFPELPGWAGTRKVNQSGFSWSKRQYSEWQWHQLGHMQICTSLQTDNHANTPPLSFFTRRMPFLQPNQQRQSTEGTIIDTQTMQKVDILRCYCINIAGFVGQV